jgi:DNA-binding beta-propeller fold protein YncE
MTRTSRFSWLAGLAISVLALSLAGGMATKLRVTHIPGAPVYKEAGFGQPLIILPLNTVMDAEVKQGEFWKITVVANGVKTTGWVHEFLVEVVNEGDLQEAGPVGSVKTQAELAAEIELRIEENKTLIRQQSDLNKAVDNLRYLLPKVLSLDDPQKQKQVACDIYLWTGHALAWMDDDTRAIKEFKNMFEVDFLSAKTLTKYITDSNISRLIATAEKQYNGTFAGYDLQINTEPKEALLKIDGKAAGRSPIVYTTENAKVTVEIEKEGYKPEKIVVPLKEGKTVKTFVLQSIGRTIRVGSDPEGAAVLLDGQDTGKVTACELPYVAYGPHKLGLKKDLFADWEEEITVAEGPEALSTKAKLTVKTYAPGSVWGTLENKAFIAPRALAIDKSGNYYVADDGPFKVRKYSPERRAQISWGNEGKSLKSLKVPVGIAIDAEGACYITDARGGDVSKFDKAGKFVRKWGDQGPKESTLSTPLGIAVDGNYDVYVVDSGNSRIIKYTSAGVVKKTWGKAGSEPGQFNLPTGVTVNSRNEVIVVDAGRVQKFTADGVFIEAFGKLGSEEGEIKRALGVCCDGDNNIYVADGGNNRVQKFTDHGRYIGSFGGAGTGAGQMMTPIAVVVNEKGSVFVLEKDNGRIQTFEPPSK